MNTNMYLNPATQKNLNTLEEYGFDEVKPREALLACGDFGTGALAEVTDILEKVSNTLDEKKYIKSNFYNCNLLCCHDCHQYIEFNYF